MSQAVEMLRASDTAKKVIILLTDGANNSGGIEPTTAAQAAKAADIRIYTVGVAKQGPARLPFPDGRVEYRDSEIDEAVLKKIAELADRVYFRAEDEQGLQEIYESIHEFESFR